MRGLLGAAVAGQGGPAASRARVLRRRLRVFGGSPAAARRWLSSCRAVQAARMRLVADGEQVAPNVDDIDEVGSLCIALC